MMQAIKVLYIYVHIHTNINIFLLTKSDVISIVLIDIC